MPPIIPKPNLEQPPDFQGPGYQAIRDLIIAQVPNTTPAQAAEHLLAAYNTDQQARIAAWDEQARLEQESENLRAQRLREEEEARQAERHFVILPHATASCLLPHAPRLLPPPCLMPHASCFTPHTSYKEWFPPPSVITTTPHKVTLVAQPAATHRTLPSIGVGPDHLLHCQEDPSAAPDHPLQLTGLDTPLLDSHPSQSSFFGAAQPRQARVPALYVLGDTDTTSSCATAPPPTTAKKPNPVGAKTADSSAYPLDCP